MSDLVGHPKKVGGDVADPDTQEDKELHKVAGHKGVHASCLQAVVQRIAKPDDTSSQQNDILASVSKLQAQKHASSLSSGKIIGHQSGRNFCFPDVHNLY